MSPRLTLEVCVDSIESARNAVRGGADRLEVCGNLCLGGGTTPSLGLVKSIQRVCPETPIMAMVRPRVGDFVYTEDEMQIMVEDIHAFVDLQIHGVVLGILNLDGTVNIEATSRVVHEALPLAVTFHRAIDMTPNILEAVASVRKIPGITRILTSGGGKTVSEALQTFKQLMAADTSSSAAVILPGSGVNSLSVRGILQELLPVGLKELHASGGTWVPSKSTFQKPEMGMGVEGLNEWSIRRTSEESIVGIRSSITQVLTGGNP